MTLLLDTSTFLWIALDSPMLSRSARKHYLDQHVEVRMSMASVWELAIKHSQGKLKFESAFKDFMTQQVLEQGIEILDITFEHLLRMNTLPYHHRDPFDRLIAAQAIHEQMSLISSDIVFDHYGVHRIW